MAAELTLRQERFVTAYLGEAYGVGVTAARIAGYRGTDATLYQTASENLRKPEIAARIAEARAAIRAEGIACVEERIKAQHARWAAMRLVLTARAEEYSHIPGGESGLLVRQIKGIGSGENFREVEEYAVDTGLLTELRQLEEHTAKELGQRVSKTALTDPSGEHSILDMSDDDLRAEAASIIAQPGGAHDVTGDDPPGVYS